MTNKQISEIKNSGFRYFRIWKKLSLMSFQTMLASRLGAVLFLLGKILRLAFFLGFLFVLTAKTKTLVNYSSVQVIFFFMTFNLIDTSTQFLFREVYRFRPQVVSGDFDLVLNKPLNPLFRALFGGADVLDMIMFFPIAGLLVFLIKELNPAFFSLFFYFLLLIFSLIISASFHIFILAIGILTTEVDNTIMVYRDLTAMGRVPVDIYEGFVKNFLIFVIPIGVMMTLPAKILLGMFSFTGIIFSGSLSLIMITLSCKFWHFSLKQYSSASS